MAQMTDNEYAVVNRGARCPFCRSYEHYPVGGFSEDNGHAWRKHKCEDCGKSWIAGYIIAAYEGCQT